jgi:tRNA G18 (ribose-2'-O)-methylase SpoU
MTLFPIDDVSDVRLDDYRNVPDGELLRNRGIFVAEGRLVVMRLLTESRMPARSVMVTPAAHAAIAGVLPARPDLPVYVVSQALMDGITGFNMHRGCLAIGERPKATRAEDLIGSCGFRLQPEVLVVLERVANADNVGGVFRNAAAFGAAAVLVDDASTDPLYRKAIRTSMGASLVMPFARVASVPAVLGELRRCGFALIGLTPSEAATDIRSCAAVVAGRRTAIVLGHEGEGVSDEARDACDYQARIPMAAGVDSLNVASASAVALYELSNV